MNAPKLRYRYAHTLLTCAIGMVSLNATAAALLRAIRTTLQRTSPGAGRDAQLGAVSFLHRFGSALNPHFHVVVLDGLFAEDDGGAITFHEATHFCADDVHRLQRTLQRRVLRLFERRGLLDARTVADMLTWQASGGFSLDASVRIHGTDSAGRERLLRYCALERLRFERQSDARHQRTASPSPSRTSPSIRAAAPEAGPRPSDPHPPPPRSPSPPGRARPKESAAAPTLKTRPAIASRPSGMAACLARRR